MAVLHSLTIKTFKMKTFQTIFIVATLFLGINVNAQFKKIKANGNIITETRTVANFDKISVSGSFDVKLIKGNEGDITIKASDNLMEVIVTEVDNGNLKIKFEKGVNVRNSKTIHITVAYETVNAISLSGSGDIHSNEAIFSENLDLSLSGSGNFKIAVSSTSINSSIAGSGNMNLTGTTDSYTCSISGSGNMNSQNLKAKIVNAKISGSGNVKVHAENEIYAKSSGSGNIAYSGNPTIIKVKSSGSGNIHKRN